MVFDSGLSHKGYIKSVLSRVNKTINLLQKFQTILPWHSLITIYKSFIRPHLTYGNVIYNCTYIKFFHQTLESTQYSTAIAMTGTLVEKIIFSFIQYFKVNFIVIFLNQYQILTTHMLHGVLKTIKFFSPVQKLAILKIIFDLQS